MPSPDSNRRNLENARSTGRVKFWRSHGESQRVKAEILQAYFAVPRPSQRAIAARLHCEQPYVQKIFDKIRREGPEKALGPEAYEIYKSLRATELSARHESLVAEAERARNQSLVAERSHADIQADATDAPGQAKPSVIPAHIVAREALLRSGLSHGQAKAEQREGPTEYVELVHTTTGEVVEVYGSRTHQPQTSQPAQQKSMWDEAVLRAARQGHALTTLDLSRADAAILAFVGHNSKRTESWF